jgi:hypothetical protein
MKRLRSRKFCAALVIIAWVAALVAVWAMDDAGRRAVASAKKACTADDLKNLGLKLEMAGKPDVALEILAGGGDPAKAACLRAGAAAQVRADSLLFIPAYTGLVLALFLFVRSFWITPPRNRLRAGWVLLAVGLLLVVAMVAGDFTENGYLLDLIRLAAQKKPMQEAAFSSLTLAGQIKWGALAASALVLAVFWTARSSRFLVWVPRISGIAAGALLLAGLKMHSVDLVSDYGLGALLAFWLAALVQAVAVAAETMQDVSKPSPGGTVQP